MNVKPLAWREIEHAHSLGETIQVQLVVQEDQELPPNFKPLTVIRIILFGNRPLNLEFDDDGFGADLCFNQQPPQRYTFRWEDVIAVIVTEGRKDYLKICQTTIRYIIASDDDNWLHLLEIPQNGKMITKVLNQPQAEDPQPSKSHLSIVK